MVLAARWRAALANGPALIAVTVDHGLRAQSRREARAAKALATRLGIRHRTMRWTGEKPQTGLPEAARAARYHLLAVAARAAGAGHILTAHTLDDQAETVLLRMARGSGMTGLAAMARATVLPGQIGPARAAARARGRRAADPLLLVRPLLDLPKARLIATLEAAQISFCEDPSNVDPRFTRARLRELMPVLAGEGLDAKRLALLAQRLRRAEATIELAVRRGRDRGIRRGLDPRPSDPARCRKIHPVACRSGAALARSRHHARRRRAAVAARSARGPLRLARRVEFQTGFQT